MSNILKSNFIQFSTENTRVIDSNAVAAKHLEGASGVLREKTEEEFEQQFDEEGNPVPSDPLSELTDDYQNPGETEEQLQDKLESLKDECDAMLDEANEEVARRIEEAKSECDAIREAARKEGYEAGQLEASKELEAERERLAEYQANLQKEYEEMVRSIEPEMVEVITNVYEHVFGDNFFSRRDVLVCLINKALMHVDSSDRVTICVSQYDYDMLVGMKAALLDKVPYREEPEIMQRDDLAKGQAKIETPFGIIDCSIDTELKELARTLTVLSYEGRKEV